MSRHCLVLGLLVAGMAVLQLAIAGDTAYWVVTPLYSGGRMAYMTSPTKSGGPLLFQAAVGNVQDDNDVQHYKQWFGANSTEVDILSGFVMFSWFDQTLVLDSYNGKVAMRTDNGGQPTQQWMVDTWGRLCTSDMKYMAKYSLVSGGVAGPGSTLSLVPYAMTPVEGVNQFVFLPDQTAATKLKIYSLYPWLGTATQMCVDAGTSWKIGYANTPTLQICDASKASQDIELLPPFVSGNASIDAFPGWTRIRFKASGLCLALSPPFGTKKNNGRDGNSLLQVGCETAYSQTTWRYNSRGQLESAVKLTGSQNQAIQVCLGQASYGLTGTSCSLTTTETRWLVR